jgi:hypothetical protein
MRKSIAFVATGLLATPAVAGEMNVAVEIPRLRVAEYHKPYIAIWVENEAGEAVATLDVWYDDDKRNGEGTRWLPELRTWWRRAGRSLAMPADGVSGPTQAPGRYNLVFKDGARPLGKLAPGAYKLRVEAAREVGGRELVTVPFQWPPKGPQTASAQGQTELGAVAVTLKR